MENNWWGSTDINNVVAGIYDFSNNGGCAFADFLPYLDASGGNPVYGPSTGGTWIKAWVYTNTTWDVAGSPYIIIGHTLVNTPATLTIDPGVEVKFNGNYYLDVDGRLVANGTETQPIIFTSNLTNPTAGSWNEIRLASSVPPSSMSYCHVRYSNGGIYLDPTTATSPVVLDHCVIKRSSTYGIRIEGGQTTPVQISNCEVDSCGGTAIYTSSGDAVLTGNTITNFSSRGIYGAGSSLDLTISGGTITQIGSMYLGGGNGIYIDDVSSMTCSNNTVNWCSNGLYINRDC